MMTRGVRHADTTPSTSTSGPGSASLPAVSGAGSSHIGALPAVSRPRAVGHAPVMPAILIQSRVSTILVGRVSITYGPEQEMLFSRINSLLKNKPSNQVWFNSESEMTTWLSNGGMTEGIGIWEGKWVNLVGKGPIIYAEERHDANKYAFIKALNIRHYLVESESEKSLTGIIDERDGDPNVYTGDEIGKGHALENYWTRSAMSIDNFWGDFSLKNVIEKGWSPTISHLNDFKELMRVVSAIPDSTTTRRGIEGEIAEELSDAKQALGRTKACFLGEVIDVFEKHLKGDCNLQDEICKMYYDKSHKDHAYEREAFELGLGESPSENPIVAVFDKHLSSFKQAIMNLGNLQFRANASSGPEASDFLREDARRVGALASASEGERPLEVRKLWEGRRELFMLRNIREALSKGKKPLLITMGADHARNQQSKIETLVGPRNLVIGDITRLADLGAQPAR